MYAMSQVDLKKLATLAKSMHSAFDVQVLDGTNPKPSLSDGILDGVSKEELISPEKPIVVPAANPASIGGSSSSSAAEEPTAPVLDQVKIDLKEKFANLDLDNKVKLKVEKRGWVISLTENTFFNSGGDEVKPESLKILDCIATTIEKYPNLIRVEGYTDNTPIHTERFPSNWELSTARATFVIKYLISHFNFTPARLSAAGYGEYHPVAVNTTPEGRAANRRVDIVLLNEASANEEPPQAENVQDSRQFPQSTS